MCVCIRDERFSCETSATCHYSYNGGGDSSMRNMDWSLHTVHPLLASIFVALTHNMLVTCICWVTNTHKTCTYCHCPTPPKRHAACPNVKKIKNEQCGAVSVPLLLYVTYSAQPIVLNRVVILPNGGKKKTVPFQDRLATSLSGGFGQRHTDRQTPNLMNKPAKKCR